MLTERLEHLGRDGRGLVVDLSQVKAQREPWLLPRHLEAFSHFVEGYERVAIVVRSHTCYLTAVRPEIMDGVTRRVFMSNASALAFLELSNSVGARR